MISENGQVDSRGNRKQTIQFLITVHIKLYLTCFFPFLAPEFIKRLPSTEEVVEGSTVTFMCQIAGFPRPTVTWYRDEEVLGPDSRAKTEVEGCGIHSINIKDVSKCDAGIYKIHASNLEGSSKSMLYISVKGRLLVFLDKMTRVCICRRC